MTSSDEDDEQIAALISNSGDGADAAEAPVNQPLARLRDTSRSRLQRMGALYSNTDDLSSPIHRTEAQFHAGDDDDRPLSARSPRRGKQRFGKLAALADTINQWEDDTAHHEVHRPLLEAVPPPKPDLPSRPVPEPRAKADVVDASNKTKQLKWDPKVLSSLEAQGFQRRDSSTIKHTYDYAKQEEASSATTAAATAKPPVPEKSTTVSKVAKTFGAVAPAPAPAASKPAAAAATSVKSGLVSGRAAIFENKANGGGSQSQAAQRNQKDPCELSLKERMKLFETGNSKAMLPKAPIGTAPSISQIRADETKGKAFAAALATTAITNFLPLQLTVRQCIRLQQALRAQSSRSPSPRASCATKWPPWWLLLKAALRIALRTLIDSARRTCKS